MLIPKPILAPAGATAAAEQHAARVHAHARIQASVAVCGLNLGAEHAAVLEGPAGHY